MDMCFLPAFVSPTVIWQQQGFFVSQKGSSMGVHVSEDHCNKRKAEKQSIIFQTYLCTLSDATSSGGIIGDEGRERIVIIVISLF